ncbi:MAG: exodeoxyribonuclease VII large subunit [Crocinitomicaceae bacterium]|nr:exodeoxyribonuclease VII large subunit [Crocinitomicaceae bacterium]
MAALSLLKLNMLIRDHLAQGFGGQLYWVVAEVSSLKFYAAKNFYFLELVQKEENGSAIVAKISASVFGTGTQKIRQFEQSTGQRFENNLKVMALVEVDFHVQYGLKLSIRDLDTNYTLGELEKQRRQTLTRLVQLYPDIVSFTDGIYRSKNQKLTLPAVIQRIAIITSEVSDGYSDFIHELMNNRWGYVFSVIPFFTRVQGAGAGNTISALVNSINQSSDRFDILVIVRGGGTQSDFMAFDEFDAALSVASSQLPVLTGIGHLKNESIVDMMACKALKTPTKAAEEIFSHNRLFEEQLLSLRLEISNRGRFILSGISENLGNLRTEIYRLSKTLLVSAQRQNDLLSASIKNLFYQRWSNEKKQIEIISALMFHKSIQTFVNEKMKLKWLSMQVLSYSKLLIRNKEHQLMHHRSIIKMMSPAHILRRGFALISINGKIISDPEMISKDSMIDIHLGGEKILTQVLKKTKDDEQRFDL